jgi:sulfonate transport system permease protein
VNRRARAWILGTAAALTLVGGWQAADAVGLIDFDTVAPPSEFVTAWWRLVTEGRLLDETSHTLRTVALSWVLAVTIGVLLGAVLGISRRAAALGWGTVTFLRFVPPPALVPVVIIIFGFQMRSEVTVAAYAATWPVLINTAAAVGQVDPRLHDVGRTIGLGSLSRAWKLVVPACMPMIVAGARIASSLALVVVITAEMIGIPRGLGYEIVRSSQALRPDDTYAYVAWVGVLGVVLNVAIRRVEAHVLRWQGTDAP